MQSCIVTDQESAIIKAIELELPNLHQLHCWNHLYQDVRFWLRKHGAPRTDITVYRDDISHLFQSHTEEYNKNVLGSTFFKKELHPLKLVTVHVGRWKLESLYLYNPYSGITNNQSEGFNTVMKEFQAWKEAPVDSFVLALILLYSNEIQRGLAGM